MQQKNIKYLSILLILTLNLIASASASVGNTPGTEQAVKEENSIMSSKHYTDVADSYIRFLNEKNLEGILSLYAENGSVEDPVGSEVLSGKARLREFYSGAVVIDLTLTRTGPVRVAGQEAAFPFQLLMEVDGVTMKTDIIDVFRFDKDGKIVQMRAFWEPDNRIPATE